MIGIDTSKAVAANQGTFDVVLCTSDGYSPVKLMRNDVIYIIDHPKTKRVMIFVAGKLLKDYKYPACASRFMKHVASNAVTLSIWDN